MYPTIGYHLAQAHIAGPRHQAQRDTPGPRRPPGPPRAHLPAEASPTGHSAAIRRLLSVLGTRTAAANTSPGPAQGLAGRTHQPSRPRTAPNVPRRTP